MSPMNAFAVAGSLVAAIVSWLFLQFPGLLLWASFIGWASYAQCGGDVAALRKSIACNLFGVVMAWLVAMPLALGAAGLPIPLAAAGLIAIVTPVIILGSKLPLLSVVPATFYGFATSFAFLVQTPGKLDAAVMTSVSLDNVMIVVSISLIAGAGLGVLHGKIAGALMKTQAT